MSGPDRTRRRGRLAWRRCAAVLGGEAHTPQPQPMSTRPHRVLVCMDRHRWSVAVCVMSCAWRGGGGREAVRPGHHTPHTACRSPRTSHSLPSTDQAHSVTPMAAHSSSRRSSRRCVGPPLSTPPTPIPPTRHTAEPSRSSTSVRRPSMAASAAESAGHWPRGCCPSPAASGGWHTRCVSRGAWPCLHHIAPRPSPATRSAPPAIASDPACCVHVPCEWAGGTDPERLWRSASRGWLWRC